MSEEVQSPDGSPQGSKGALEGEDVALRQARQKAYKARQREVGSALRHLYRLRKHRERFGLPGVKLDPSWDDLLVLVRELIHEEERIAAVSGAARSERAVPQGQASEPSRPARQPAQPAGLSTDHIVPQEKKSSTKPKAMRSPTRKKNGKS